VARRTAFAGFRPNRKQRKSPHQVAVLAFDGVVLGDLATPLEIFQRARDARGQPCYEVSVCSPNSEVMSEHLSLKVPWRLSKMRHADTLVIPGIDNLERPIPPEVIRSLKAALKRGARIASICTGAFMLAAAGALTVSVQRRTGRPPESLLAAILQSKLIPKCSMSTTAKC